MQLPNDLINEAIKEAKIADYVLEITNKVIKDKKIVVSTLMHLKKSINLSIKAYFIFQKEKGNIHNIFSDEYLLLNYFMDNYSQRFSLNNDLKKDIMTIFDSIKSYDLRGMILEKNDKYTFISENYELINFKFEELKKFIKTSLDLAKSIEVELK
ncbi:MAG: hypothetical protein PHN56_06730 [Candidatus Nanoarchaeia archaeon]|nr:hypothetical protein [Candidatus Nanoarchaeia archaeon]